MKISESKSSLKAKLAEAINAAVKVALEDPSVSHTSFLEPHAFQTHAWDVQRAQFYRAWRRKLVNANTWEPFRDSFVENQLGELFGQALKLAAKRYERAAAKENPSQFFLPGYERIPRRKVEGRTVRQVLALDARSQKRAGRDQVARVEFHKLADAIRGQPLDLDALEALELATGGSKKAARSAH